MNTAFLLRVMAVVAMLAPLRAQNLGDAEAQKCEERIAAVQRDVLGKYDDALSELQLGFQKIADLEGALAVRTERQRLAQEQKLTEQHFVTEPKSLRALQQQMVTRMQELVSALVQETLPKLIEYKRGLTMQGKLDEALAVRGAIERLQNAHVPLTRAESGVLVPVDTLLRAYGADRGRADRIYKGQKITVRGIFGGSRQDANDGKLYLVFLAGSGPGWVQCSFSTDNYRFREETQFNSTFFVISSKGNDAGLRLQKGQQVDIRGVCEGLDEVVRLAKCEIAK